MKLLDDRGARPLHLLAETTKFSAKPTWFTTIVTKLQWRFEDRYGTLPSLQVKSGTKTDPYTGTAISRALPALAASQKLRAVVPETVERWSHDGIWRGTTQNLRLA